MLFAGFHLENFPWGGSSLGSSCYVSYMWSIASFLVVPSLACGAVTSLACHESAVAYDLILVVISLGGEAGFFGGEASSLHPPPPSRWNPASTQLHGHKQLLHMYNELFCAKASAIGR